MKILIIGNGGREHTLAWKSAQSDQVDHVFVAPGNAGTALEPKVSNVAIDVLDFPALIQFAKAQQIDLTLVGPEAPLAAGIVNTFVQAGLPCFGPTREAAQLEASKAFSKDFMLRHNLPTARFAIFTDLTEAKDYVKTHPYPLVIKADGLASGKGVVIVQNYEQALITIESMLGENRLGKAGHRIVIEAFLVGEEASFIVITDGEFAIPLATSQDHKTRDDGDTGPNTGGMGAYSPAPVITSTLQERIMAEIIYPTLRGMKKEGHSYQGFLYAGLMITPNGDPKILEFNCRLGDPETQVILPRLRTDLTMLCLATLQKRLNEHTLEWDSRFALGVVLAARGYPEHPHKGDKIENLPVMDEGGNYKIFHAGTLLANDDLITNGGRVLCVTALADTLKQAHTLAYQAVKLISWPGMFYRHDIGYKWINRK